MRVGTRGSALALVQARHVATLLGGERAGVEVVTVTTSGDRGALLGDKSRWVKELEHALLAGEIDVAVHSAKDVPSELPAGLRLAAVPARIDARDALCGAPSLAGLRAGAVIGTSSLRRAAELRALRPDLDVVALRGNVDTRLRKLAAGDAEAIVLAVAGLERLGRADAIDGLLDELVPAPGQGALALEVRADDSVAIAAVERLNDRGSAATLAAERALVRTLGATCHTPLGAHAVRSGDGGLTLRSFVGLPDGSAWLRDELTAAAGVDAETFGVAAGRRLLAAGARDLLDVAESLGAGSPPPASTPEGVRL
ncbi:hydroxymethylbilane synthase [Conexibacter sp. JD483]|uniref:hydroxymethylbilane synthase n=1 Tax=unclassified Conexibacter TaxID=2627773 RepID=UPI002719771D|nr:MULTISPECIES: hydroxymethylbilane synthase [unclassified Conexibacter]MDO8184372.1 hydroxymethylbilane synthase [Conexibacter sp. CPCC 205706]MDO8197678.1 hydroxymethylbilane synthase [Conexibacter sp. CPCC 205762]MDR9368341.1 hydroxymethylbilane synthase [Conexibacter sp. JD483]